ncbi:Guanylate cyclase soluble subunit beta-2, partial [Blyttiomyces sp. JEL0837]
ICTIGDAYIVAGGLPSPIATPALALCRLALQMQRCVQSIDLNKSISRHHTGNLPLPPLAARIGIFTGALCGALIGGKTKLKYDLFGDAYDFAVELEQNSIPGKIHISQSTLNSILGSNAITVPRGNDYMLNDETT